MQSFKSHKTAMRVSVLCGISGGMCDILGVGSVVLHGHILRWFYSGNTKNNFIESCDNTSA